MNDSRRQTYFRLLVETITVIVSVIALALLGRSMLRILLPFILAFIIAWAFNPLIRVLQRHLRLTRKLFSYILVIVFYTLLFVLCLIFARQVISQLIGLASSVPTIIAQMQSVYNRLVVYVKELLVLLPPEYADMEDVVLSTLANIWDWLRTQITGMLSWAVSMTSGLAMEVPSFVIFLTVLVLASCIITADFPNLRENIYSLLGVRGKKSVQLMGHSFRIAVLGFFRSQLIFALIDMGLILVAFFLIGVHYPLPIALVLCFLDFIPFFGAGTVLIPWGAACLMLGFTTMGIQLILLYAILYILRRIFEPHVLGGSTGFSSLQMLFSMYAGMQLAGVTGLIIAPIVWITAVNFLRTGVLDGVFEDARFVVRDIRGMIARPDAQPAPPKPDVQPKPAPKSSRRTRTAKRRAAGRK